MSELSTTGFSKAITAAEFEKYVIVKSQEVPILVDFWADWCGPCKQLMPILHQLVDSLDGQVLLATVNTDEEQELAMQMGIRSLPTVALFKNGEMVEQFSGVKLESEINALIAPYLEQVIPQEDKIASDDMQKAIGFINQGETEQAIPFLKNDTSLTSKLLLIKIYLQAGEVKNATQTFDLLDEGQKQDEQAKIVKTTIDLIAIGYKTKNEDLQGAIEYTITTDPIQGIEQLLGVLAQSKTESKEEIKKSLIIAFDLIEDVKLVSQLRRKMAALIF